MNPSINGWIAKFGKLVSGTEILAVSYDSIYKSLRNNGFVYGYNIDVPYYIDNPLNYSTDECAKINLIDGLYRVFLCYEDKRSIIEFLDSLVAFYDKLDFYPKSKLPSLTSKKNKLEWIEKCIDDRVRLGDNVLTRNFNRTLTNTLLFVDILTYKEYLRVGCDVRKYAINLESVIMNISLEVSNHVKQTGNHKLSLKYSSYHKESYFFSDSKASVLNKNYRKTLLSDYDDWVRLYFMDISCSICYSDLSFSEDDILFTNTLANEMGLSNTMVEDARKSLIRFFKEHNLARKQLKDSNPLLNFYDHSYNLVSKLIQRNLKRILKEVTKSKDLVFLLAEARKRSLTIEEQKTIQNQLLDILKTIPSLAIFLLPGGAILLPIFAKILPNLLPSSFDENRV